MKYYIAIFLLVVTSIVQAQEERLVTVSYEDVTIEEAILSIEQKTPYTFYFVATWFKSKKVSGAYNDADLSTILDDLFNDTVINYFILDDAKVILTQNNTIYSELPEGYFNDPITVTETDIVPQNIRTVAPVFNAIEKSKTSLPIETVRIGKENLQNSRKSFTLRGAVFDERGAPLPNVSLVVANRTYGTTTNEEGNFTLQLAAGVNLITTRSLGFLEVTKQVIMYNDGELDIVLIESLEQLDAVLIEGSAKQNVENATTGVTKIDVKEIKNIPLVLGERDILKVATTLPGISTAGEGSAGYNVRGGKEDQNLILLDDGVIYNPSHFFGIFSGINPFTTQDVTIHKGNIPAEFGGRLSSVIDIISKDANDEKFSAEGSIGPVTGSLTVELPTEKEKGGLLLGGRTTYSNWILRSLDEESLQNSQANFFDIIAKYHHDIGEKDKVKATGYYSKDAFSITSDSLYNYSNRMVSLQWDHDFSEATKGSLGITNSNYEFGIDFDGASNDDFELGYSISETGVRLKMKTKVNEKHTLDYGLASKLYQVNPGSIEPLNNSSIVPLTIPEDKGLESAVFISDAFRISDKLQVNAGVRFSMYSALGPSSQDIYADGLPRNEATLIETQEFSNNEVIETYGGPEFRVSTRYFINSDFSVKASYNNTYQYIHTLTNNTTVSPTDTWKLSNINIAPQEAQQYSLGFYKNLQENSFELSLEGYYKTSQNILDFKTGAQLLLNDNIETEVLQGEGKSYGVEFLLKKKKGRLNGWLGYTYSRSLIKFDSQFSEETINAGDFFPSNFDKPHDVSLVANYKFTKRFSLSANFVYQTGRPVTVPVGNFVLNNAEFVLYSDRNQFRIPDYYRFDISFNVEGNHKNKKLAHSFWNISIYNVLGRNNPYSVFFVTDDGQVKALQSSIFSIPIPTITYNFKF